MVWVDERSILQARQAQLQTKRENYKQMHRGTAERKGVLREFLAASTLTQMRKVLWG